MEFDQWQRSIPFVTKYFMLLALATAALISFKIVNVQLLLFYPEQTFKKMQLWRLFTHFFVLGKFSFNFVFEMMMFYFGVSHLEEQYNPNRYAELFYLIFYNMCFMNIIGYFLDYVYLSRAFSFALLYIWCKRSPFEQVQFLFGLLVKSGYLPWVIIGYTLITGESIEQQLIGLVSAHIYIVLKDIMPNSQQRLDLLRTPRWMEYLTNKYYYTQQSRRNNNINQMNPNQQQQQQQQAPQFRAFGGRGVRLG